MKNNMNVFKVKVLFLVYLLAGLTFTSQAQWTNVGTAGFSPGEETSFQSLAFHPTTHEPYVAFSHKITLTSDPKTTVMKFNGTAWELVGTSAFSAGTAIYQSLAFHPTTHEPYVAYQDGANSDKTTVMKFNGTAWENVGTAGFSGTGSSYQSLAFHPTSHEPYVAFSNGDNGDKTTVMKFNGTAWENVGTSGFSVDVASFLSLDFHPTTHEPYVAYVDDNFGSKAVVMKFNGTAWESVGTAGFSAGPAPYQSLAFHPTSHEPYVAYMDFANTRKATVMKFNGTAWEVVGTAGFSAGISSFHSLAFNPASNEPYVFYQDGGNSSKGSMMKFNGTAWEVVGIAGFSARDVNYTSLAFHPTTNEPYVAYQDLDKSSRATVMKFSMPEINIKESTNDIASGGEYNFNSIVEGASSSDVTFTIENTGTANLTLSGTAGALVVLGGTNADQFSVVQTGVTSPITGNSNQTFTVKFSPTSGGQKTATLTISNNDGNEGTYVINLKGTGIPLPTITSFTPTSGIAGTTVTITGTNFDATAANNTVKFNGTSATVTTATTTSLTTTVPTGATTGKITVEVNGQTATSAADFVVIFPPTITDFTPKTGKAGDAVTITGTNFDATSANNTVKFNGTIATITSATTTELKVTVPTGVTTGKITVEVNGQTATSSVDFALDIDPIITDFNPKTGKAGDVVTITGNNFDATAANNVVKFNGAAATVTSATATELKVTVTTGVTTGKITVEVNGKTATSTVDFLVIPPPTITDFNPKTGKAGDEVTITGANFDATAANNVVKFNGTAATVKSVTSTELKVTVPTGVTTGKITVEVNGQTATSSDSFTVETNPTGLPENLQNGKLTLFPNPVENVLKLKFEGKVAQQINLIVYNALGAPMLQITQQLQNGEIALNLTGLPSGKYILKIQVGDEVVSRNVWKK